MAVQQNISWTIQSEDLAYSPLGYKVELGETRAVFPKTATHSTFEGTDEFEYLVDGVWLPYPVNGLLGAAEATQVRMLCKGETPTSTLVLGNDSVVLKMAIDGTDVLAYKQVCETNSFHIDSISCNADGQIWVKDTGNVITVLDRTLRVTNTMRVDSGCLLAVVDPFRNILWKVFTDHVDAVRITDMESIFETAIPETEDVLGWDFSTPSGTLFLVLSGDPSFALAVATDGSVTQFAPYATGVCQWGSRGAIACMSSPATVCVFDGDTTVQTVTASSLWLTSATRVTSQGHGYFLVTDSSSRVVKADESLDPQWLFQTPSYWSHIDVKTTPGPIEEGRVSFLTSPLGVASYRDLTNEAWMYGSTEMPITPPQNGSEYILSAIIPELRSANVSAKISPVNHDIKLQRDESSESSESSAP